MSELLSSMNATHYQQYNGYGIYRIVAASGIIHFVAECDECSHDSDAYVDEINAMLAGNIHQREHGNGDREFMGRTPLNRR